MEFAIISDSKPISPCFVLSLSGLGSKSGAASPNFMTNGSADTAVGQEFDKSNRPSKMMTANLSDFIVFLLSDSTGFIILCFYRRKCNGK